ncbi:hypothetical protein V5G92_23775 [Salmonella enterica subsp. enterica serovar Heidelberg]
MSFKLLQHRRQVGAFLEQQLPVQLENVLQVDTIGVNTQFKPP